MDAFASTPPAWVNTAIHAVDFRCPTCKANASKAHDVWINRRAPVSIEFDSSNEESNDAPRVFYSRRKWQEFYLCQCDTSWWGWSSDRPPTNLDRRENPPLF